MHSHEIPEHFLHSQNDNEEGTSNTNTKWITINIVRNDQLQNKQYICFPPHSNFPVRQPHQCPAYLYRHCKSRKVAITNQCTTVHENPNNFHNFMILQSFYTLRLYTTEVRIYK